jgi:hypothetical protein
MALAGMLTGPAAPRWSWLVLWAVSAWASAPVAVAAGPALWPALPAARCARVGAAVA